MPKGYTKLCLFFKGSQAKSSHREAYLVNEGQPNYVFLALVPILPTDQWHFVTLRYRKSLLHVGVCVSEWERERERDVHIDFNSWQSVLVFDVFVYIECKYVWNWNKKKIKKNPKRRYEEPVLKTQATRNRQRNSHLKFMPLDPNYSL